MSLTEFLIILVCIIIIIGLVSYIFYLRNQNYIKFCKRHKKELEEAYEDTVRKLNEAKKEFGVTSQEYEQSLRRLQEVANEIKQKETFNQTLYQIREEELNNLIENKKKSEIKRISKEINEWAESAQEAATFCSETNRKIYELELNKRRKELDELTSTINDYKARRDVINQEILRARAIEEQQDFYRVQLDDNSKEDIQVLNDIRQRLNKTDLLNKLIYENYIARPTKEMVKRVLEGKNPSGIYKVTNIKTNEIYIGKSTKIADRFQNHIKSACGLEGVAESQFQRALKKYGVDNFTWELLEEVPKENLSEREKYYIMFYGTKDYGYNQREG